MKPHRTLILMRFRSCDVQQGRELAAGSVASRFFSFLPPLHRAARFAHVRRARLYAGGIMRSSRNCPERPHHPRSSARQRGAGSAGQRPGRACQQRGRGGGNGAPGARHTAAARRRHRKLAAAEIKKFTFGLTRLGGTLSSLEAAWQQQQQGREQHRGPAATMRRGCPPRTASSSSSRGASRGSTSSSPSSGAARGQRGTPLPHYVPRKYATTLPP